MIGVRSVASVNGDAKSDNVTNSNSKRYFFRAPSSSRAKTIGHPIAGFSRMFDTDKMKMNRRHSFLFCNKDYL